MPSDLVERLCATFQQGPVSGDRPVNPDGPEAATLITQQYDEIQRLKRVLRRLAGNPETHNNDPYDYRNIARDALTGDTPTLPDNTELQREVERLRAENEALKAERDKPEVLDFMRGVPLEAEHQRARWGAEHDAGKTPFDWFWLVGYLAQKAATSAVAGDPEKAKHHTISTAAALANWHSALCGATDMRPGIGPGNGGDKPGSAYSLAAALASSGEGQ